MRIESSDARALLEFLELLYTPSSGGVIESTEKTKLLAALLHVDFIGHSVWDDELGKFIDVTQTGRDVKMEIDYREQFQFFDPVWLLAKNRRDPVVSDNLIKRADFLESPFFKDFLFEYDLYSGIDLYLHDPGTTKIDYRFWTSDPKKQFDEREIDLLNALRPHLANEFRLRGMLSRDATSGILSDGLPTFSLREATAPVPNHAARSLIASLSAQEKSELHQALFSLLQPSHAKGEWRGYHLYLAPSAGNTLPLTVYLVAHTVGSAAWLQQKFNLTSRESSVCHLLLRGLSDKQIADSLSISYWTVRVYVGKIFNKLGIDSRSAIGSAVLQARNRTESFNPNSLSGQ